MVERIGQGGALAREAILAALRSQARAAEGVRDAAARVGGPAEPAAPASPDFAERLRAGLGQVDGEIRAAERLPVDLLEGRVDDFHQIAVQLKQAEVSFRFAMEIRNKLIDAYREVMRMNV